MYSPWIIFMAPQIAIYLIETVKTFVKKKSLIILFIENLFWMLQPMLGMV